MSISSGSPQFLRRRYIFRSRLLSKFLVTSSAILVVLLISKFAYIDDVMIYAIASTIALLVLSILLLLSRPKITDATFIFILFFIIYQIVIPIFYVTGSAWVVGGDFFVGNWDLLLQGNIYCIIGLLMYSIGLWLTGKLAGRRIQKKVKDLLPKARAERIVAVLLLLAVVAWLVMFVKQGMPLESLMGRSPDGRVRSLVYAGGFAYVLGLVFASNVALLVYCLNKPHKRLFSVRVIIFLMVVFVLNGLDGSRLILFGAIISVIFLRVLLLDTQMSSLLVEPKRLKKRKKSRKIRLLSLTVGIALLFSLSVFYGIYRGGGAGEFFQSIDVVPISRDFALFYVANTFDTSISYFMVVDQVPDAIGFWYGKGFLTPVLLRIPTIIIPWKYEFIWAAPKFTQLFYGYNQNLPGTVARGPNMTAEAYLSFGAFGVAGILFIFGIINERLSRRVHNENCTNFFKIIYVIYLAYFIPYVHKSGLIAAISFIDIKMLILPAIIFFVMGPLERAGIWQRLKAFRRPRSVTDLG